MADKFPSAPPVGQHSAARGFPAPPGGMAQGRPHPGGMMPSGFRPGGFPPPHMPPGRPMGPGMGPPGMMPAGMGPPGMGPPGMGPPGMGPPGMMQPGMGPPGMGPPGMHGGRMRGPPPHMRGGHPPRGPGMGRPRGPPLPLSVAMVNPDVAFDAALAGMNKQQLEAYMKLALYGVKSGRGKAEGLSETDEAVRQGMLDQLCVSCEALEARAGKEPELFFGADEGMRQEDMDSPDGARGGKDMEALRDAHEMALDAAGL